MKNIRGLTLIELLAVVACVAVLAALLIPVRREPVRSLRAVCMSNLHQIGIGFLTEAYDNNNRFPMSVSTNDGGCKEFGETGEMWRQFQVISTYLPDARVLACPKDERKPATNYAEMNNNNISYFLGLDANTSLKNMLLAGDRNLVTNGVDVSPGLLVLRKNSLAGWTAKIHNRGGNIGLVDGSVMWTTNASLQTLLSQSGTNVNRLTVP
jgi:prepilin-type N-terminal cleavage/methylation domain-containing protein/prepilin-type processing-associated H-X9-DG protein